MHYPSATRPNWCGGHRRARRAWPRCPWAAAGRCHSPPTGTRTTQEHNTTRPTTTAPGPSGTKLSPHSPSHRPSPHIRYKTLPAHPPSPHIRYKTLPAHQKWLNLALFMRAGRVLYRCHHQEAEQGEFCTEREAEIERATTGQQAPLVWKAPGVRRAVAGLEGTGGCGGTGGHGRALRRGA